MELKLKDSTLKRICEVNSFQIRTNKKIFFGFQELLPVDVEDSDFGEEQSVALGHINYINSKYTVSA